MVCFFVLILLWLGVSGGLFVGSIDLASVLWPSFFMLTTTWRSTVPGIVITGSSVVLNCLLYAGIFLALGALIRLTRRKPVETR
jgi:hypothetical protein